MTAKVLVLVGTKKGVFIAESADDRRSWQLRGPFCETWPMNHVVADPATGTIYGAGGNEWFGAAIWKSTDFGESWTHSSAGLAYPEGQEPVKSAWSLAVRNGRLYAGVQPAGIFQSDDGGVTWDHLDGLQKHPTREHWMPGGAGLILHSLVHLGRHLVGRRVPQCRRRQDLGAAQPRHTRGLHAGRAELPRVRPVRALPGDGARR
jgi:photosystem II stability/assembly factor-like uncharacterized protein